MKQDSFLATVYRVRQKYIQVEFASFSFLTVSDFIFYM